MSARVSPAVRFGIVGTGAIAAAHAGAIRSLASAKLAGVTDIDATIGRTFAAAWEAPFFESLETLIETARPDFIVVCTPPSTHPQLALAAISAGCHVLCEKPLAIDEPSAIAMLDAAAEAGVILTMATKFRYVADIIRARSMIKLGALGQIHLIANEFRSPVSMEKRWNSNPALSGGGVFIDNGTHSVDILRYLAGPLESVSVTSESSQGSLSVEDDAQLLARFTYGAFARVELSWARPAVSPYFVQIVGSQGRALIGWKESKYRLEPSREWQPLGTGYDKLAAFERQYENLVDVIAGRAAIEVGREDALSSVQAIAAGYASLRNGGWMSVDGKKASSHTPDAERAIALL
ncbi:MAG: Gfo/Idh/MocA family oxidoreductase [Candidatus Baltobacteraceae bacterium]|jgi:predicted dehydrogenase